MNRWTLGLILGFAVVLFANGVLVYSALSGDDPIDPTYVTEAR